MADGSAKLSGRNYEFQEPTLRRESTVSSEDFSGESHGDGQGDGVPKACRLQADGSTLRVPPDLKVFAHTQVRDPRVRRQLVWEGPPGRRTNAGEKDRAAPCG